MTKHYIGRDQQPNGAYGFLQCLGVGKGFPMKACLNAISTTACCAPNSLPMLGPDTDRLRYYPLCGKDVALVAWRDKGGDPRDQIDFII